MAGEPPTVSSKPNLFKRVFLPVLFLFLLTVFLARLAFDKEFFGMLDLRFWKQLGRIGHVMEMSHQDYLYSDKVSYDQLADSALNHMLDGLDRYSTYYNRQEYEEFNNLSHQTTVGIGIETERRNGVVQVVRVFKDSPADKAGWLPWDQILKIGNVSVSNLSAQAISDLIKGPANSTVSITRERPGKFERDETLTRGNFDVPSIRDFEILANNVAYLRITQFGEKTGAEFTSTLNGCTNARGLVLDLRDNPGGLVDSAVDVLDSLLPPGTLVMTTTGRDKSQPLSRTYTQGDNGPRFEKPIIVLVNGNSASASEIVAGALQDWHRAVIVGERTYGKGVVQSVFALDDGSGLRLTTEAYTLPNGRSIQDVGINPDIPMLQTEEQRDLQRFQRADQRYFQAEQKIPEQQFVSDFGFAPVADPEVELAAGLIRSATPDFVK